jgi:hypothetical protein
MTSRAPEKCSCGLVFDHIPEGWGTESMKHALHIIDSQAREIEELRALVKEAQKHFGHVQMWRIGSFNPVHDEWERRAESALAKPHAGKGP